MARDSFVKGALILTIGLGLTKVLGFYRLVLPRVIGSEGVGLFNAAYPVYSIILVLSTAGIPVAISKLVAEKQAQNDLGGASRVFQLACWLLASLGLLFSAGLFFGADAISRNVFRDPRAFYPLVSISPAIFFVSIMSAYRGLFQGMQIMAPAANSYVIEQVVRVGTLFALMFILLPKGIEFAAAGATFGAVTGGMVGLVYLIWEYNRYKLGQLSRQSRNGDKAWTVLRSILTLAIPISLAGLVFPLMQSIDLVVVPARLQLAGVDTSRATAMYGELAGEAMPVIYVPTIFTTALAFSLVPAVSEAAATGSLSVLRSRAMIALRVTVSFAIPATIGIYMLATDITRLLYNNPGVGPILAAVSSGVLFLAVQQVTSGILQGLGRTDIPVKNLLLGAVVKLLVSWILMADPSLGIMGAAYGTVFGFLTAAALNLVTTYRVLKLEGGLLSLALKPVLAAVMMAIVVRGATWYMPAITGLSPNLVTLVAITAGAVVYSVVLIAIGGITERDLEAVPGYGKKVARVLKRARILRR